MNIELTNTEYYRIVHSLHRDQTQTEKYLADCHGSEIDRLTGRVVNIEKLIEKMERVKNTIEY